MHFKKFTADDVGILVYHNGNARVRKIFWMRKTKVVFVCFLKAH